MSTPGFTKSDIAKLAGQRKAGMVSTIQTHDAALDKLGRMSLNFDALSAVRGNSPKEIAFLRGLADRLIEIGGAGGDKAHAKPTRDMVAGRTNTPVASNNTLKL